MRTSPFDNDRAAVTAGRKMRLRLDVPDPILLELPFWVQKRAEEMARSTDAVKKDVRLVTGQGWQIVPLQVNIGRSQGSTTAQSGIQKSTADGGPISMPSGMLAFNAARSPSDIVGATTGASGDLATTSDPFYQLSLKAGEDVTGASYNLAADQSAYPTDEPDQLLKSNRVGVSTETHAKDQPIIYRFFAAGAATHVPDLVGRKIFSGPAGSSAEYVGSGQYKLVFWGDGRAWLCEKIASWTHPDTHPGSWKQVAEFRYCVPNQVFGTSHFCEIRQHFYNPPRPGIAGHILITVGQSGSAAPGLLAVGTFNQAATTGVLSHYVRYVGTRPATSETSLRTDVQRDLRPAVQVAYPLYPASGYVLDDVIVIESMLCGTPLKAFWFGDVPTGCSVEIDLIVAGTDPDDSASWIASTSSGTVGSPAKGGWKIFNPPATDNPFAGPFESGYQVKVTLRSNTARTKTPTIYGISLSKDAIGEIDSTTEIVPFRLMEISATGAEGDFTHETAAVRIEDEIGALDELHQGAAFPAILDTEYPGVDWTDSANEGRQSVLIRGYLESAEATNKGRELPNSYAYPSIDWHSYDATILGMWMRLFEAQVPRLTDFSIDPNAANGEPYKATDVLRALAYWAGLPPSMVNIPDLPLRLFSRVQDDGFRLNLFSSCGDAFMRICRDYLGMAPHHAANSGTGTDPLQWHGQLTLIEPKRPPYTYLAYFSGKPTLSLAGNQVALVHTEKSYPTIDGAVGAPIFGRPRTKVIRPEANYIEVIGTGFASGADTRQQYSQVAINYSSFNAYPGKTTALRYVGGVRNPDYLGRCVRIRYVDSNLTTQEAVDWVCRRLFDVMAHGIQTIRFTGPMVLVTDPNDASQKRPRPLRYYDPIKVNGVPYLIRSCNPTAKKDGQQLALYEAESPREPYL